MRNSINGVLFLIIALMLMSGSAPAETPRLINYQGHLSDETGTPVESTVSVTFAIYEASTGGTALWSETHPALEINGGLFAALLGSVTSIPADLFSGPSRWLGISVGTDPELEPRTQLVSAVYALRVGSIDGASGGTIIDSLVVEGKIQSTAGGIKFPDGTTQTTAAGASNGLPLTGGTMTGKLEVLDSVTFGSETDTVHLEVTGSIHATDYFSVGHSIATLSAQFGVTYNNILASNPNVLRIGGGHRSGSSWNYYALNWLRLDANAVHIVGNTGMGIVSPSEKLDVLGNIKASGTIQSGNSIIIDGVSNTITSTETSIGFGAENLVTTGSMEIGGFSMSTGAIDTYVLTSDAGGIGSWQPASAGGVTPEQLSDTADVVRNDIRDTALAIGFATFAQANALDDVVRNDIRDTAILAIDATTTLDSTNISPGGISLSDINQSSATTGQVVKWNGSAWLPATDDAGSGSGFVDDGAVVRLETSSDLVGVGTASPMSPLGVAGVNKWAWHIGNGWGDFSVGDGTYGFGIGISTTGGGAGTTRLWPIGGSEVIKFGNLTNGDLVTITQAGEVGIGVTTPTEKLDVVGNVHASGTIISGNSITIDGVNDKITASGGTIDFENENLVTTGTSDVGGLKVTGGATAGYVLTSDASGNATWQAAPGGGAGGWTDDGTKVRLTGISDSVGIGTASPSEKLDVNGNIKVGNSILIDGVNDKITASSGQIDFDDERLVTTGKVTIGPGNYNGGLNAFVAGENDTVYASGTYSKQATISGGYGNSTNGGPRPTIGGGYFNSAGSGNSPGPTVGGGYYNTAIGAYSTISGGQNNTIPVSSAHGTIGGGFDNYATVAATVGGGSGDSAWANFATVSGGEHNVARAANASIGGGKDNLTFGGGSVIGGGQENYIDSVYATSTTIGGGIQNSIGENGQGSTIGGGMYNKASGTASTIPGGWLNSAVANRSFAAGSHAKAHHQGSMVLAANASGATSDSVSSGGADQMVLRADGGIYLTNIAEQAPFDAANIITTRGGAYLSGAGTTWTNASDRDIKENFTPVNPATVLEKIASLPISQWNYKEEAESIRHIGPMAQDFRAAFELGEDERHIATIDADGVALAAIKALYEQNKLLQSTIEKLAERISELEGNR